MKTSYPNYRRARCREVLPSQLKAGDQVKVPWGIAELIDVSLTDTCYTITVKDSQKPEGIKLERAIGNCPAVHDGTYAESGQPSYTTIDGFQY